MGTVYNQQLSQPLILPGHVSSDIRQKLLIVLTINAVVCDGERTSAILHRVTCRSAVQQNKTMDFDDDFDDYKRPSVLPVASFDHYDPEKPPTSGEEYLRRVQLEALKCPEVAIADLDVDSFLGQQTEVIPTVSPWTSFNFNQI